MLEAYITLCIPYVHIITIFSRIGLFEVVVTWWGCLNMPHPLPSFSGCRCRRSSPRSGGGEGGIHSGHGTGDVELMVMIVDDSLHLLCSSPYFDNYFTTCSVVVLRERRM